MNSETESFLETLSEKDKAFRRYWLIFLASKSVMFPMISFNLLIPLSMKVDPWEIFKLSLIWTMVTSAISAIFVSV
jgi:hypothetical protein